MARKTPREPSEAKPAWLGTPTVFIVDDDPQVSAALREIVEAAGYATAVHASAESFVREYRGDAPGCLVLDVHLPGMSGLELQQWLAAAAPRLPIIMLTGRASVKTAVLAMKAGAFTYVEKPACPCELQRHVRSAVESDIRQRQGAAERTEALERVSLLSDRERQVMQLLKLPLPSSHHL